LVNALRPECGGLPNSPQVLLYRPTLKRGSPLDEALTVRWIGIHFFFSFGLSYLKAAKQANLAGDPEVGTKTSCRPRFHCAEWSCGVLSDPPRLRIKIGKDWPVKSRSGKLIRRTASASRRPAMCARLVRFRHRLHVALKAAFHAERFPRVRTRKARLSVAPGAADPVTQTRPSVRMGSRADAVSGPLARACPAPIAP